LKHLPLDPDIFSWFPLRVGNKWVYTSRFTSESEINEHTFVTKVARQFRYNDKTYFDINSEYGLCYRVDSTSGKIYRSYFNSDTLDYEELYIDLTSEIGDTIYVDQFDESYPILLGNEEGFNEWDLNSRKRDYSGLSTPLYNLSLVKNIGLYYQVEWELVGNEDQLKGAIINGKVYGDTTVVDVNDPNKTPKEFYLSQNYPNPFNPSTKIKYVVPKSSFVNLKIYDALGREVTTLVNEEKHPGEYEVEFSAKGGSASGGNAHNLSSGIYFYHLQAGKFVETKKMILLR
jgi:Secretion system C-terminal sorting domain